MSESGATCLLEYNKDLVDASLMRNKGKYEMVTTPMSPAIGEVAPIHWDDDRLPVGTKGLGLMGFTDQLTISGDGYEGNVRRGSGEGFQSRFYIPNNNLIDSIAELLGLSDRDYENRRYDNYLAYVQDVYLNDFTWLNSIQQWLDQSTMKGTLEYSRVGVVHDIDIFASLNGVNVTNINNFSGQDTPIGYVANRMYAQSLHWAAYFNSVRNTPHITTGIDQYIGLNQNTEAQISGIFRNSGFGRVNLDIIPELQHMNEPDEWIIQNQLGNNTRLYLAQNLARNRSPYNGYATKDGKKLYHRYQPNYSFTYTNPENGDEGRLDGSKNPEYLSSTAYTSNDSGQIFVKTDKYLNKTEDEWGYEIDSKFSPSLLDKFGNLYHSHAEGDVNKQNSLNESYSPESNMMDFHYDSIKDAITKNGDEYYGNPTGLLKKTQELFRMRKIGSLIGRFHSTADTNGLDHTDKTMFQTATSQFGISRGRNLLTKEADKNGGTQQNTNGYGNPYCRTWTFHHQYDRITRLIRPFTQGDGNGNNIPMSIKDLQKNWDFSRGITNKGGNYLGQYTALQDNGFVRITPSHEAGKVDPTKCMFSIENLAWKGVKLDEALSEEQRGPLGGRIMWFPPYNLRFSENVGVNVENSNFIGRGEPVYTYSNTERSGSLSFTLVADHPSILDYWEGRTGNLGRDDEQLDNDLLRFFAGCDTINGKSDTVVVNIEDEDPTQPIQEEQTPPATPKPEKVVVYVFFPNNYSGIDDIRGRDIGPWNGMDYLFYGVQCGKECIGDSMEDMNPFNISNDIEPRGYEMSDNPVSLDTTDCPYPGIQGRNGKIWQYRIDDEYVGQQLVTKDGYKDTASFKLNSELISDDGYSDSTNSFAELYVAINNQKNDSKVREFFQKIGGNTERVDELREKLTTRTIEKVTVSGVASSHGNNPSASVNRERNNSLSDNRCNAIANWLTKTNLKLTSDKIDTQLTPSIKQVKAPGVSSREAKLARYAKIVIELKNGESQNLRNTQNTQLVSGTTSGETRNRILGKRSVPNLVSAMQNVFNENREPYGVLETSATTNDTAEISYTGLTIPQNGVDMKITDIPYTVRDYINDKKSEINHTVEPLKAELELPTKLKTVGALRPQEDGTRTSNGIRMITESKTVVKKINKRYDDEYKFFSKLPQEAPMFYRKLKEKIKFFDPVFHSTTPEGFNARLTFLHQCTRQGPTVSSSDKNAAASASNLSFGMAPFCVLRIGDFYNTRIIIESISIEYDVNNGISWDLNPEGIGIQPLMANVTLNFKFIGGSSLSGPIVKLQNAVSFNFYGNTGVYDDRADRATYGSDGNVKTYQEWLPTMLTEEDSNSSQD